MHVQFKGPPPPIAQSVVLPMRHAEPSTSRGNVRPPTTTGSDPLLVIERRQRAIQKELQGLLDAQSAGLVRGFGGGAEGSEAGSSTPTAAGRSREREGIVPVRQPKKKVMSLRGARRGLLRDMEMLAGVKEEESRVLGEEMKRRERVLERVKAWEERMQAVQGELEAYSGSGEDGRAGEEYTEVTALQKQERTIDHEIRELEDRLMQLRARKNWLGERIREGVNRREARLSSYKGALREVESEVKEFLRRPPVDRSLVMGTQEGFTALPPSRRTLGMAKEWWTRELTTLSTRQTAADAEKTALHEGAELWTSTIDIVTAFEEDLRRQMASTTAPDAQGLHEQVGKMGDVIAKLESNLHVAESKHWNLLVCAVGAELEAFKEGEGILRGALGMDESPEETFYSTDDGGRRSLEVTTEGLNAGGSGSGNGSALRRESSREESTSEDEGPNLAELMVDRSLDEGGVD